MAAKRKIDAALRRAVGPSIGAEPSEYQEDKRYRRSSGYIGPYVPADLDHPSLQ